KHKKQKELERKIKENSHEENNSNELILPKIETGHNQNRNYVLENKRLITENKVPKKNIKKEKEDNPYHKDYGKTPEYLKQYMKEEEDYKEYQRIKKEKAKYPKGTRLVGEEEKQKTLKELKEARGNIQTILEKMPIARLSLKMKKEREELYQRLDEIDKGIELFSRKQVFVKE
ncbi:MAG: enkurin domain-containing protein, partial [archaeon]|nr:enkurin domain-containing protein [archaeon]